MSNDALKKAAEETLPVLEKLMGVWAGTCAWHADVAKAIDTIRQALAEPPQPDPTERKGQMVRKLPNEIPQGNAAQVRVALDPVTIAQMEQAFEAWERGFRIEPDKYRTAQECICLGVSQVSAERADYFFQLLWLEQQKPTT